MRQPSVGLDLDGVVAKFHPKLIEVYNERYNGSLTLDDFNASGLESLGQPMSTQLIEIFNEPGWFLNLEPDAEAVEIVTKFLDCGYKTIICTAPARRPKGHINGMSASEKFDWVQKNLPFWGNDLVVTKHKEIIDVDVLIDDYPSNVIAWADKHEDGLAFLVDRPWNQYHNSFPPNVIRGPIKLIIDLIDRFWCQQRGKFVYRYDELQNWQVKLT